MSKRGIIGLVAGALALTAVVAPLAYIGFSYDKISPDGEYDVISISSEGLSQTLEYDFGMISPSESRKQTFKVQSIADKDINYNVTFLGEEEHKAYKYFNISVSINDENIVNDSLYECVSASKTINRTLQSRQEEEIIFSYKLADDIPENMLGMTISFELQFKAKLF